jgi:hypothetical protein
VFIAAALSKEATAGGRLLVGRVSGRGGGVGETTGGVVVGVEATTGGALVGLGVRAVVPLVHAAVASRVMTAAAAARMSPWSPRGQASRLIKHQRFGTVVLMAQIGRLFHSFRG